MDINVWYNVILELAKKQIKMVASRNAKKIDQIVAINANRYAILVKNASNSHVKLKYSSNANVAIGKQHYFVGLKVLQKGSIRENKFSAIKNVKI